MSGMASLFAGGRPASPGAGLIEYLLKNPDLAKRLGVAGGAFATSMAPGSGVADAAGVFPDFAGGFAPSYSDNMSAGNYGSAALQTLGMAGDAALAVPLAGMAASTALKTPKGLANAIKAFGLAGREAKQVETGITKLSMGKMPTAAQQTAVENAARGGFTQARNAITKANPELKAAPPGLANAQDLSDWREKWAGFHEAGAANAPWYADSAEAIRSGFNDPERAAAFTDALAASSQRTQVGTDLDNALRSQYAAEYGTTAKPGEHIPNVESRIESGFAAGTPMAVGGKVGPFAQSLASGGQEPATRAVWDSIGMRGAGYGDYARAENVGKFLDPETMTLVERANRGRAEAFLPLETLHGGQARIWEGIKAAEGGGIAGRYNYADAMQDRASNMILEAQPGATSAVFPQLQGADQPLKQTFFDGWKEASTDELGYDIIGKHMGFLQLPGRDVSGAFQGNVNPARLVQVVTPEWSKTSQRPDGFPELDGMVLPSDPGIGALDPLTAEMVTGFALAHGRLDFQDAMAWHRPFVSSNVTPDNATFFQLVTDGGRPLTTAEQTAIYDRMRQTFGSDDVVPIASPGGANFLKFDWVKGPDGQDIPSSQYISAIGSAADDVLGSGRYDIVFGQDQRFFQPNDWKGGADASAYDKAISSLRPEIRRRVTGVLSDRAPRIAEFYAEFGRDHGWQPDPRVLRSLEDLGTNYSNPNSLRPSWAGLAGQHLLPLVRGQSSRPGLANQ